MINNKSGATLLALLLPSLALATEDNAVKVETEELTQNFTSEWNVASNIYMEMEKFEGHRDPDGNAVIDKLDRKSVV